MGAVQMQKKIDLDKMPVINLTQRAPAAGSLTGGGDDNGEVERDAVAALATGKNLRKVVPRPDDEPSVFTVLSGNSVSGYMELCGWTLMTPFKFFNLSDSTQFHKMTDGRGEIVKEADDLLKKCISLREMTDLINSPNPIISCPLFVHVVAKRKVDIIPVRNKALVIPLVVIADKSGYCVLCSINEGLATIYNTVEVGDMLLISRCLPQKPRRTYHRGLFCEDMFLDMEIKLQFHSVRTHYIYPFTTLKLSRFMMPEALFMSDAADASSTIKLPCTLQREFQQAATTPAKPTYYIPPNSEQYYDIVGVVTYVGRIERFQNMDNVTLDTVQDGKLIAAKIHPRFLLHRWIYLTDLETTSAGFPVKVYINNATNDQQVDLVPGAIIALTHCITQDCPTTGKYATTSQFSQIYAHGNIEKYYMIHPQNFRNVIHDIIQKNNYVEIISRKDIQFMAGGTHQLKIENEEKFKIHYLDNKARNAKDLRDKPIRRRESRRLYFEGEIMRVVQVDDDGVLKVIGKPVVGYQVEKDRKEEYHKIENFLSYRQHANTSWFCWQRKLPEVDGAWFRLAKCRDICRRVVGGWKDFMGVLGIPSGYEGEEGGWKEGELPKLGKLERVDGPPYLVMDVVNKEDRIWYGVMWKGGNLEEKLRKVGEARGRKVCGMLEVFCTEVDSPLEVNLVDFVVMDE